ncbi:unnamed protein product [Lampetra planeri]
MGGCVQQNVQQQQQEEEEGDHTNPWPRAETRCQILARLRRGSETEDSALGFFLSPLAARGGLFRCRLVANFGGEERGEV